MRLEFQIILREISNLPRGRQDVLIALRACTSARHRWFEQRVIVQGVDLANEDGLRARPDHRHVGARRIAQVAR